MTPDNSMAQRHVVTIAVLAAISAALATGTFAAQADNEKAGRFTEQLVQAQSKDDILDAGALFVPPKKVAKPIAVIWIHGWGVNFYSPTYVAVSRSLVKQGYTAITGNTRMHGLGNVEAWREEKRIRGGGYWGVTSEETRDLAAWIDFPEGLGFEKVVLVGHSVGASAVLIYQAKTQDARVVGVVLASGTVRPWPEPDSESVVQAKRMIAEGQPEDLVRIPNRSSPSFISAATLVDLASTNPEFKDVIQPEPAASADRLTLSQNPDFRNQHHSYS